MRQLKKWIVGAVALFLILLGSQSQGLTVKNPFWFDQRLYYLDLVIANSSRGETVKSMKQRSGAVYAVNGGYFGRNMNQGECDLFMIGRIQYRGQDLSKCPLQWRRGRISMGGIVIIGFKPIPGCLWSMEVGPVLVLNGRVVQSYQYFYAGHWNRVTLRNIIAIKGNRVYFLRVVGSLWKIAKYLEKSGYDSAFNLDGGSSSRANARVMTAIVVKRKTDPVFLEYLQQKNRPAWLRTAPKAIWGSSAPISP